MRHSRTLTLAAPLVLSSFAAVACAPDWPTRGDVGLASATNALELDVTAEPHAALDALPRVVRFRLRGAAVAALKVDELRLFEGDLNDPQLGYADDTPLPTTLAHRRVALSMWRAGADIVLAPEALLMPAARYTLTHGKEVVARLETAPDDGSARLSLHWPPEGRSPTGLVGVYCGEASLPAVESAATLEPSGAMGVFRSGVLPGDASMHCVHFEPAVSSAASEPRSLPPLALRAKGGGDLAAFEPRPLVRSDVDATIVVPRLCEDGAIPFGPGCARVMDDRLRLDTPDAKLLFSVQGPAGSTIDHVFTSEGQSLHLWPLPPDRAFNLTVSTLDPLGGAVTTTVALRTERPQGHLVIDEVLANPMGPEPAQEWVELVNDGLAAVSLAGVRLMDSGSETPLPDGELAPGARALVVSTDFNPSGKWDPAPAPGTVLLRVASLGKGGLSNDGEALELVDGEGRSLSTFPAIKTKPGRSAYRVDPKSLTAFSLSPAGGSTPGAKNAVQSDSGKAALGE